MTLAELMEKVDKNNTCNMRIRELENSNIPVIVEKKMRGSTRIQVYQNGRVVYQKQRVWTVFSVWDCSSYVYQCVLGDEEAQCVGASYFKSLEWYYRLVLEGEDRLEKNQEHQQRRHHVSGIDLPFNWQRDGEMFDPNQMDPITAYVEEQEKQCITRMIEEFKTGLSDDDRYLMKRLFDDNCSMRQLAGELGISAMAVSKRLKKLIGRLKAKLNEYDIYGL